MKALILTLVGKDKPGLVESLAQKVYALDGNWLSSNFSYMAGHFAGFAQVNVPVQNHPTLISFLEQHPHLTIHSISTEEQDKQENSIALIEVVGNDKPGIVQELTAILSRYNINIMKFESSCQSAPNWGNLLFKATATVSVPPEFDLDPLSKDLEDIANDLVVDIEIK